MKPKQLAAFLTAVIPAKLPVLIKGPPGVGKSDIMAQVAEALNYDMVISHLAVKDATDATGLPFPSKDGKSAVFLPIGEVAQVLNSTRPTIWFWDDFGQAMRAVQAGHMQWLLARQLNGLKLPDHVVIVAATNRRSDKAGVDGLLEPVKSRFSTIVELEPALDDLLEWGVRTDGLTPHVIAYLRLRPGHVHMFEPTNDLTNSPCPRSWAYVSKLMKAGVPSELRRQVFSGAIGDATAVEFVAALEMFEQLPSIDNILMHPDKAEIPKEPALLYAVSSALAHHANQKNIGRVLKYTERLISANKGEFATYIVRDATRRNEKLCNTPEFIKAAAGTLGKLISGESIAA